MVVCVPEPRVESVLIAAQVTVNMSAGKMLQQKHIPSSKKLETLQAVHATQDRVKLETLQLQECKDERMQLKAVRSLKHFY